MSGTNLLPPAPGRLVTEVETTKSSGDYCNPRYENFPPIMSDGRIFIKSSSPIIPEKVLPNIQQRPFASESHASGHCPPASLLKPRSESEPSRIPTNWEYRNFMTKHANSIRKQSFFDCLQL